MTDSTSNLSSTKAEAPDWAIAQVVKKMSESKYANTVRIHNDIMLAAAKLARESVGDGELLPCPFCGGAADPCGPTATPNDPPERGGRFFPVVRCKKCWAKVSGKDHDESCQSAITAWNTRAAGD